MPPATGINSTVLYPDYALWKIILTLYFWDLDLHLWVDYMPNTDYMSNYTSKVMFKILQARLQQYINRELPDVQAGFRKGRGPEIKLPTSSGSLKKQESSRKTSISALLTMPKPLTVWITTNSGKFWKRWKYQTTWPTSWEICMQVRKQQLELDLEQQTSSK